MSCSKPMGLTDLYNWKVAGLALATSSAALLLVKLVADHFSSNDSNGKDRQPVIFLFDLCFREGD